MDIQEIYKQWIESKRDNILMDNNQFSRDKIKEAMMFAISNERKRIMAEAEDIHKNVIASYESKTITLPHLFLILYK